MKMTVKGEKRIPEPKKRWNWLLFWHARNAERLASFSASHGQRREQKEPSGHTLMLHSVSIPERTVSDIIATELYGDWWDPEAIGRLSFLLDHSSCAVIFFEAVGSHETADQDTSNYAQMFINSHPLGREREREKGSIVQVFNKTLT